MTVAQLIGGTVSNGLTSKSSEWNTINRMTGSFCSGQPRGPPNFVALVDRKRLSHSGVFRHCSLATNHETMSFPSRLARQRKHNFSVVNNQLSSDCGVHSSSYVDESSTVEEHCLTSSMDVFTENPNCQPHVQNVKQELIMLSLPAIAGQAIEPLAQLMETTFIGRLGGFLIGETLAVLVIMTLGTSMVARQGMVAMAAHQICLQVWLAVSLLTDALAVSGQALIASSYSKGDYRTLREVGNFALKIGLLIVFPWLQFWVYLLVL